MIHVVFNEPDIPVLQQAMELEPSLQGDVMVVRDDYAVGPIAEIYSTDGIAARRQWWREVLSGSEAEASVDDGSVDDPAMAEALCRRLREDAEETVWIWAAQNKHDVCGYFWLMPQLQEFQGRVHILYLNNLPFISEKGNIFYPTWLSQIPPREFRKAMRLERVITPSEYELDPEEWRRLCQEETGVRLLEGGKKLLRKDLDYYDSELRRYVAPEWQKASRIIHQFLNKAKETTGDMFLLWRLKTMAAAGVLDMQGTPKGMRDFELKSAGFAEAQPPKP